MKDINELLSMQTAINLDIDSYQTQFLTITEYLRNPENRKYMTLKEVDFHKAKQRQLNEWIQQSLEDLWKVQKEIQSLSK